jgi:hypothetical protein
MSTTTMTAARPGDTFRVEGTAQSAWPDLRALSHATAPHLRQAARDLHRTHGLAWIGLVTITATGEAWDGKAPNPKPAHGVWHTAAVGVVFVKQHADHSAYRFEVAS